MLIGDGHSKAHDVQKAIEVILSLDLIEVQEFLCLLPVIGSAGELIHVPVGDPEQAYISDTLDKVMAVAGDNDDADEEFA